MQKHKLKRTYSLTDKQLPYHSTNYSGPSFIELSHL